MKKSTLSTIAFLTVFTTFAQTWSLDKTHSKLGFEVSHLMISSVEGYFKSFDAKITSSKEDFSDAVIELTADVNSINTEDDKRDNHLRSTDFFDAAKYNSLVFKSASLKKTGANTYKLTGDLTIHGITKSVVLDVTFGGTTIHPYTKQTLGGFKVTGTIKRSDFGIGNSVQSAIVGDEIIIYAKTEFAKN